MHRIVRHRFSILLALVVALSVNALADLAGVGGARTKAASPVQVVKDVMFRFQPGQTQTLAPGQLTRAKATCPSGLHEVAGAYGSSGKGSALPMVVNSTPGSGNTWHIAVLEPRGGRGSFTFQPVVVCAKISYATVQGS